MTTYNDTLTEAIQISQTDLQEFFATVAENLEIGDTFSEEQLIAIIDAIAASDALSSQGNLKRAISENIEILDILLVIVQALASENIQIDDGLVGLRRTYRYLTDLMAISDVNSIAGSVYAAILTAALLISDEEAALTVLAISEGLAVSETLDYYVSMARAITEAMELSDTGEPSISFFSVVADEFFTDSQFDTMQSFIAEIQDGIQFTTVINSAGESWVGYVINPEGYAVSTYDNYKFNSIAHYNRNYLGAAATGLYEIGGTDDDGDYIIAKLLTAVMDFGTSNRKYVPTLYLGVVNDSKLVLKVSVDGRSTSYYELTPDSNNLDTQYIKIGKGLVGRYWQFELITKQNEGLDIDSIEFFPLTMGRKI